MRFLKEAGVFFGLSVFAGGVGHVFPEQRVFNPHIQQIHKAYAGEGENPPSKSTVTMVTGGYLTGVAGQKTFRHELIEVAPKTLSKENPELTIISGNKETGVSKTVLVWIEGKGIAANEIIDWDKLQENHWSNVVKNFAPDAPLRLAIVRSKHGVFSSTGSTDHSVRVPREREDSD